MSVNIPTNLKDIAEATSQGITAIGKNDRTLHIALSFASIVALLVTIWYHGVQYESQRRDFFVEIGNIHERHSRALDKFTDQVQKNTEAMFDLRDVINDVVKK